MMTVNVALDTVNVVLDIDKVLACSVKKNRTSTAASFFEKKDLILHAAEVAHYIFPGVIEFLTLLLRTEKANVSVYSAGETNRNHELVELLLKRIYQQEEMRPFVKVLSRKDLVITDTSEKTTQYYERFTLEQGPRHKDLLKVIKDMPREVVSQDRKAPESNEYALKNTVLVDDKFGNIAPGQAKNFLYAGKTSWCDYSSLKEKYEAYQKDAYRPLKCSLEGDEDSCFEVDQGKRISFLKKEDTFEVWFIDKENVLQKKKVPEEYTDLLEKLKNASEKRVNLDGNNFFTDSEMRERAYQLVESFNGRTKKLPRSTNRIFYITGLLFTAIGLAKTKNISLSDALFELQFEKKPALNPEESTAPASAAGENEEEFELSCQALRDDRLFELGLKKLQEINPDLHFTTPYTYLRGLWDVKNITASISST